MTTTFGDKDVLIAEEICEAVDGPDGAGFCIETVAEIIGDYRKQIEANASRTQIGLQTIPMTDKPNFDAPVFFYRQAYENYIAQGDTQCAERTLIMLIDAEMRLAKHILETTPEPEWPGKDKWHDTKREG